MNHNDTTTQLTVVEYVAYEFAGGDNDGLCGKHSLGLSVSAAFVPSPGLSLLVARRGRSVVVVNIPA